MCFASLPARWDADVEQMSRVRNESCAWIWIILDKDVWAVAPYMVVTMRVVKKEREREGRGSETRRRRD